jgi:hypothetical protein
MVSALAVKIVDNPTEVVALLWITPLRLRCTTAFCLALAPKSANFANRRLGWRAYMTTMQAVLLGVAIHWTAVLMLSAYLLWRTYPKPDNLRSTSSQLPVCFGIPKLITSDQLHRAPHNEP